jgi:hypothetical protein
MMCLTVPSPGSDRDEAPRTLGNMSATVPPLFRLTLINDIKRREPTPTKIPAQRHDRRSFDQHQKFELYFDATKNEHRSSSNPALRTDAMVNTKLMEDS